MHECVPRGVGLHICHRLVFPVPEAPRNISVLNVTDTTVTLSWLPPVNPNGLIEGYRIYFTTGDFTNATWIKMPVEKMQHTLTDLGMFWFSGEEQDVKNMHIVSNSSNISI